MDAAVASHQRGPECDHSLVQMFFLSSRVFDGWMEPGARDSLSLHYPNEEIILKIISMGETKRKCKVLDFFNMASEEVGVIEAKLEVQSLIDI